MFPETPAVRKPRGTKFTRLNSKTKFGTQPRVFLYLSENKTDLVPRSLVPSEAQLQAFNSSVNGRLIRNAPYGASCYKATYDAETCKFHAANKHTYPYRLALPAALMYTNWEYAENGAGCGVPELPADGSAPPPIDGECTVSRKRDTLRIIVSNKM